MSEPELYKKVWRNSVPHVDFPFVVPGYEQIPLTLRTSLFGTAKILYQGVPLQKVPGRKLSLTLSDGTTLILALKINILDMLVPRVIHNDHTIQVAPKLPAYQQVLVYVPFVFVPIGGGAIGGVCGGIAAAVNLQIFHSSQHAAVKVFLSVLTLAAATGLWLLAAIAINLAIRH